ncbi:unnamed protein product, partial [Choristocarpus tenellus]
MATKIKDGLFIGDAEASQDPEFIELNKVTYVINCAGRQLPNLWEQHGLRYLTFPWDSTPDCMLFDGGNVVIKQITSFIDEAQEAGDSILVHSMDGTSRCIACLAAFLMYKYRWGFEKALDFLCSKRLDAAPNPGFLQQLYHLDLRLCTQWYGHGKEPPQRELLRHDQWVPPAALLHIESHFPWGHDEVHGGMRPEDRKMGDSTTSPLLLPWEDLDEVEAEELVLVHSFLNGQPLIDALPSGCTNFEVHPPTELHWIDQPRIDKLLAAGRIGLNERHTHRVPVSPNTGHPVPERPSNSSYSALS